MRHGGPLEGAPVAWYWSAGADFNGNVGRDRGHSEPQVREGMMHIERFNLCAAILFLTAPGLAQSVDFDAPRIYQVENGPYSLPVGDFNGDGKLDLVAETGNGTVILLGNGDGTFQPGANVPNVTGNLFVVGDFNGDGKLDLATADAKSKNNVAIFLGNGDGTFQAGKISLVSGAPTFLAVGDFNGDGKLDLAVAVGKEQ